MPRSSDERAYVGLGANVGDRAATIESAIAELDALPRTRVAARSSLYESAPVVAARSDASSAAGSDASPAAGGDYLNAVVAIDSELDSQALLAALQAIEARHGRVRPHRNAPRTLDLDLLLHGDRQLATPTLVLPHPRLAERAFVLLPLAEIAPGLVVPGLGSLGGMLGAVAAQRIAKLAG